jgi:hypothetical protein
MAPKSPSHPIPAPHLTVLIPQTLTRHPLLLVRRTHPDDHLLDIGTRKYRYEVPVLHVLEVIGSLEFQLQHCFGQVLVTRRVLRGLEVGVLEECRDQLEFDVGECDRAEHDLAYIHSTCLYRVCFDIYAGRMSRVACDVCIARSSPGSTRSCRRFGRRHDGLGRWIEARTRCAGTDRSE